MTPEEQAAIATLRHPQTIRDRCQQLFDLCAADQLENFACDLSQLDDVAAYVVATTQQLYPDFDVPFHSRWRHFDAGGEARLAALDEALRGLSDTAAARSRLDLAIVSVLLDAGAGSQWRYHDAAADQVISRSEGLAVASLRGFETGCFSSDPDAPYQVDAVSLQSLTEADLAMLFQVSEDNPLVGLSGRLSLLHQLGQTLATQPARFGSPARPGNLLDYWQTTFGSTLAADKLLTEVLESFGTIWPGR
ncbi:MAG: DUF1688 family protein, partial [Cyanobacteria bacterium P01_E01_bin.43]